MQRLTLPAARAYLAAHGLRGEKEIDKVLGGFETRSRPLYLTSLAEGDTLLQFVRNPSLSNLSPGRGGWFCLDGATQHGLAITGGLAGREPRKFTVRLPATALEGTAGFMPDDMSNAIGGPGGQTQLYVPPSFIGRIQPVGAET